jgi:hypothetical protein
MAQLFIDHWPYILLAIFILAIGVNGWTWLKDRKT